MTYFSKLKNPFKLFILFYYSLLFPISDTCTVATGGDTFEGVKEKQVTDFKQQLNGIVDDIHQTLESQTPDSLPNGDTSEECKHLFQNRFYDIGSW